MPKLPETDSNRKTPGKRLLMIGLAVITAAAIAGLAYLYIGKQTPVPAMAAVTSKPTLKADYLGSETCAVHRWFGASPSKIRAEHLAHRKGS